MAALHLKKTAFNVCVCEMHHIFWKVSKLLHKKKNQKKLIKEKNKFQNNRRFYVMYIYSTLLPSTNKYEEYKFVCLEVSDINIHLLKTPF